MFPLEVHFIVDSETDAEKIINAVQDEFFKFESLKKYDGRDYFTLVFIATDFGYTIMENAAKAIGDVNVAFNVYPNYI